MITTPFTFVATCEAIQYVGARPIFVDIDPRTLNLNPALLPAALSVRTRALLPVHIAGQPAAMPEIMKFANRHAVHVIDDAAHALEAEMGTATIAPTGGNGVMRKIGTIGEATCFSFYATQNMTTGEGGMVTCQDYELANRIRMLSLHGLSRDAWKRYTASGSWYYEVLEQGYKYNLTDIAAALGLTQLAKVGAMWQRRAEIAVRYNAAFGEMPELEVPPANGAHRHAWHLYILRLNLDMLTINRDEFFVALRDQGISCSVHFIPLHVMPYYRRTHGYRQGNFPEAERQFERVISLPLYPALTDGEVERVITAVRKVITGHRRKVEASVFTSMSALCGE